MLDLVKTADLVKEELKYELYLLEILKEDLINISALAKKLLPKIKAKNPKATIESISMAIRRFIEQEKYQQISKDVKEIISNSQILTKNDIIHMTFERNDFVVNRISEVSKNIKWNQDEILFINQGSGEITIIIDEKNKKHLDNCKRYLIETTPNLAIISLKDNTKKSIKVPGIYSYFINQLVRKSINITEVISTLSEINFVISNKDIIRAYEIIERSIKFHRAKI